LTGLPGNALPAVGFADSFVLGFVFFAIHSNQSGRETQTCAIVRAWRARSSPL
jgi:hypothetical protein